MVPLGPLRYLTVHCAATPEGRDVKAVTISAWDHAKFGQVSYHWVVELDGTKVNTLPESQRGAHVGKANTGNIGICYVGGMDRENHSPKDTRTAAQKQAIRELVERYKGKCPDLIVRGHRDWPGVAKACPSFDVKTAL